MARQITRRQTDILEFIRDCVHDFGRPPTIAEIAEEFGIASTNGAFSHVCALERKGYLTRSAKARDISLTDKALAEFPPPGSGEGPEPAPTVPLVGRIAAGSPLLADEQVERHLHVDPALVKPGAYALRVEGESMIEAGIHDGDLIIVDGQRPPRKGDIVVALYDEEATVKYFHPKGDMIELRPANSAMEPIEAPASLVAIQGVVVGLQRVFG